jgi:hypothetical protein
VRKTNRKQVDNIAKACISHGIIMGQLSSIKHILNACEIANKRGSDLQPILDEIKRQLDEINQLQVQSS